MTARLLNVGRKLHARVRDFFDTTPNATAPPLELLQAALDQIERKTQPSGRGARWFPYTRIAIHIAQPDADRTAIESVFAQLPARLRERLAELRCDLPPTFEASVTFDDPTEGRPVLRIECRRDKDGDGDGDGNGAEAGDEARDRDATALPRAATDTRDTLPPLRVSVLTGQCEQAEYTVQAPVIAIGRGAAPTDTSGRMRRNHIAFLETRDGASETVARAHARLEFDPELQAYVLFNESTTNPTFIRRDGRSLRIVPRDPRGVRVQPGDELQLGRAVLKLSL